MHRLSSPQKPYLIQGRLLYEDWGTPYSYVEAKDTREVIDIEELNKKISTTVKKINALRADIEQIIKEIEA